MLLAWPLLSGKRHQLIQTKQLFLSYLWFWCLAGSIGFGLFYSMISFSASFAPGWVVATTWQMTILASPLVLYVFGKKVPWRACLFTLIIFAGIAAVNLGQSDQVSLQELILGGFPVLVAAFAYPFGNQMLWEAQRKGIGFIPAINHELLNDPFSRILLLTLGTIPFWLILYMFIQPPAPSLGQATSTFLVALFSGVIATSLFLHARHLAANSYQIAAVDSLQSGEVLFSLIGEILFLGGVFPNLTGMGGIILTLTGLTFYMKAQTIKD